MKRAMIKSDMRMNRAHDENISFCPASGSIKEPSVLSHEARSGPAHSRQGPHLQFGALQRPHC